MDAQRWYFRKRQPQASWRIDKLPHMSESVCPLSLLWHPFTVASTPHDTHSKLKLLFRKYGYFTRALYDRLQQEGVPPPSILLDGFYFGPDWAAQAMRYDVVLIVAGGIGITPFLSMIQMMHKALNRCHEEDEAGEEATSAITTRCVDLHWSCRDIGLIRYVCQSQFSALVYSRAEEDAADALAGVGVGVGVGVDEQTRQSCQINICIHNTGSDESRPISVSPTTSDRTATTSTSSSLRESFEDELHPQEENPSSYQNAPIRPQYQGDSTTRVYGTTHSRAMEAAKFSFHRLTTTTGATAGYCLAFAVSAIGGLIFHWYFYVTAIQQFPHGVYFQAYNLYAMIIWNLLVGIVFETVHRCSQYRGSHSVLLQDEEELGDGACLGCSSATTRSEAFVLPFDGVTGRNTRLTMKLSEGRPEVSSIVAPVLEAQVPGAFFCGPEGLLNSVQTEMRCRRTEQLGRLAPKCVIYQEEFEM